MSNTKKCYHHGGLKETLVQQALDFIAVSPFEALSLRKLAALIGVNQTALYSHFKNKNALLAALAEYGFTQLIDKSHEIFALDHDEEHTLTLFAQFYIDFARANPELFKLMFGPLFTHLHPQSDSLWDTAEKSFELFQDVITNYLASINSPAPTKLAVLTIWSFMHGFGHLIIGDRLNDESLAALENQQLLEQLLNIIKNGLKS